MNSLLNFAFGHTTNGRFATGRAAWGLLALRLVMGLAFVLHGWGKIQTPFGWMGPNAPVPGLLQGTAALAEFGGGLALITGFFTPLASLGLIATMGVALATVLLPAHVPFVGEPGKPSYEIALVYFAAAVLFLLNGPGAISLDNLLFGRQQQISGEAALASTDAALPAR